jgi:NAD(P)-dependent dehydrogenase (short-subunit alcohol dehydrogenase family)
MKPANPFDMAGRVAVVTGGSGVLGGALARALGACGASVVVVARSRLERAEEVAAAIRAAGGDGWAARADVLNRDEVQRLGDAVLARHGRVDYLVNGAGGARKEATTGPGLPFFDLPEEAVRHVFDLNLLGTFFPCQVFGRLMAERKSGAILMISSYGAFRPLTRSVAYSAGKAAVTNFTQWLAVHMAQEYSPGIRVNAVVPGFFLTEQNRFLLLDEATGELTERGRRIIAQTPAGRFGEPDDLIGAVLWLLSDSARFVTGAALAVDGGIAAYGGV